MIDIFKEDVNLGLSKKHKTLPSKYFYDSKGDDIFIKIMHMPEYYLTRAEHDIFENQTEEIINKLNLNKNTFFELIELGAGDGTKTKVLLDELVNQNYNFKYLPVDISENALLNLERSLKENIPKLHISTKQGDYFKILDSLKNSNAIKIVFFLGSNIGNMKDDTAKKFMHQLSNSLNKNDKVLLGVDLIKEKEVVLPAYSDNAGITASFNMNLLDRINKELGANFNTNNFKHLATYREEEGIARSFLVSNKKQEVTIKSLNKRFSFFEGEKIHTEISRKYNDKVLRNILSNSDLKITDKLLDENKYFADFILEKL